MIPSEPSDRIEDFLEFLTAACGRERAGDRSGAAPEEIERFAALARRPLPALYLGYLREFGGRDRELQMANDADTRISSLIAFYEETPRCRSEVPRRGAVIALYGLTGSRALIYPRPKVARATGSDEPRVVISWWGEIGETVARTFRNYLYTQACSAGWFAGGPPTVHLDTFDQQLFQPARELATSLGFRAYWFSDDYRISMERDDGVVLAIDHRGERLSIYAARGDARAREELRAAFLKRFSLRDYTR